jgi:6-pyruvoyltetrahydropterin/6-carboxytetrahydropterin synthase
MGWQANDDRGFHDAANRPRMTWEWSDFQLPQATLACKTERAGMFRVSREIDFCYGHRLLNYAGKCKHLHGHNGRAIVTIEARSLDERGMVRDFSEIKNVLSRWIDESLDHRMILHCDDPMALALQKLGEPVFLMNANPTAENIAKLICDYAVGQGIPVVEVKLWETPRCFATYRPNVLPAGNVEETPQR